MYMYSLQKTFLFCLLTITQGIWVSPDIWFSEYSVLEGLSGTTNSSAQLCSIVKKGTICPMRRDWLPHSMFPWWQMKKVMQKYFHTWPCISGWSISSSQFLHSKILLMSVSKLVPLFLSTRVIEHLDIVPGLHKKLGSDRMDGQTKKTRQSWVQIHDQWIFDRNVVEFLESWPEKWCLKYFLSEPSGPVYRFVIIPITAGLETYRLF